MAGFASRGGLLRNAPLKRGACMSKEAQGRPAPCQLDKAASVVCRESVGKSEADSFLDKNIHEEGENR